MGDQSGQLGTVILKLITDNKEFAEGLKNALQLVSITSTQMKDLMEFKIRAPDFSALDATLELNQKRLDELTQAQHEESQSTDEAGRKHEEHASKMSDGAKTVQQFRTEQRLQNFVVREGSQTLLGLTTVLGFLTIGNKDAEGTTKRVQTAMLAGIGAANGMEFAMFGIGQASKNMTGSFGATLQQIAGMGGTIAAVVGVGAGLVTLLGQVNEEAERAAQEGMKALLDKVVDLTGGNLDVLKGMREKLVQDKEVMHDYLNSLIVDIHNANGAEILGVENSIAASEKDIKMLDERVEQAERLHNAYVQARAAIIASGNEIASLRAKIEQMNEQLLDPNLDPKKRQELIDAIAAAEGKLADKKKTTLQREQDNVDLVKARHALGLASVDDVIAELRVLEATQKKLQDKLATQKEINDLIRAQMQQAVKQYGPEVPDELKKQWDAEREFNAERNRFTAEAVTNRFDREKALAQNQFDTDVKSIREKGEIAKLTEEEITAAIKARGIILERDKAEIERARLMELRDIELAAMGQTFEAEKQAVINSYQEKIDKLNSLGLTEAQKIDLMARLRKARDAELYALELRQMQQTFGLGESLMNDIVTLAGNLGPEAQRFVDGFQRAFDIAKAIISIMQTINTFATIFALQRGGMVLGAQSGVIVPGSGDGDKIAIMAEPGEGILNKRAVQALGGPGAVYAINRMIPRFGSGGIINSLLDQELLSYVASGAAGRIPVPAFGGGGVSRDAFNVLIDEVRRLNEKMDQNTKETRDLADRINLKIPQSIELKASGRDLKKAIRFDEESNQ